jgi:hypothetical protein
MKFYVLMLLVAGFAVAQPEISGSFGGGGGGYPGTDDILDTYTYGSTVLSNIPASFTDYRVVDDFTPALGGSFTKFSYWYVTTAANPTALELMYFPDAAGVPSGTPGFQTSYAVTTSNSGFLFGSYAVWYAQMNVSLPFTAGKQWYGFHRNDGNNWYVAVGTVVTNVQAYRTLAAGYAWEPCSSSIGACDMFKLIEGATALGRDTWAGIKTQF